jgi:hypothetical protein
MKGLSMSESEPLDLDNLPPPSSIERLPETPTSPGSKSVPRSRIVVTQQFYHQTGNEQYSAQVGNFVRWIANDEAVYDPKRKVKATTQWQPIDTGWVKRIGLLVISNLNPKTPMRAESVDGKAGTLEVCLSAEVDEQPDDGVGMWAKTKSTVRYTPHMLIPPGEAYPLVPMPGNTIHVRCREGECLYCVYVIEG